MKIVKAYRQTDTDRDVNIHDKQFKAEHLKKGDTVYRMVNGTFQDGDDEMGIVQAILHDGYCAVLWPWNKEDEPEICKVEDLMTVKKYEDIYKQTKITASTDYDSTTTMKYNGTEYMMHYTDVNMEDSDALFYDWKEQITEIHPYDDAEYYWAVVAQGTIDYIYRGKVRKTEYYLTPEDEDIDNYDYMDEISLRAISTLNDLNKDIKPKIVHTSSDIESSEGIGVQDFDNNIYAYMDEDDYEEPDEVEFQDVIYLELEDVAIEVYADGGWDYVDQDYEFAKSHENRYDDWLVSEDEAYDYPLENASAGLIQDAVLRDYMAVVEDFDQLLESIIPRFSGRYALTGTAQLIYDVRGTVYKETFGRRPETPDDIEFTFDLDDVRFNKNDSQKEFKIAITEVI